MLRGSAREATPDTTPESRASGSWSIAIRIDSAWPTTRRLWSRNC